MALQDINKCVVGGNLTRDGELHNGSQTPRLNLRLASNSYSKRSESGTKPNFFDVTIFGGLAEAVSKRCAKGAPVVVTGRLDWSEYKDKDGNDRQSVSIIGDDIRVYDRVQRSNGDSPSEPVEDATPVAASEQVEDIPF